MLKELVNKDAVIFDLDGTLVDSMWMWGGIDREYLNKFGILPPDDLQEMIEGKSFTETAAYFKERFRIPHSIEEIKEEWNAIAYDKYLNQVPLKKGVKSFLNHCREMGLKMGIATSNSKELVQSITQVHGLNDYFTVISTACEVDRGKPSPDIYLLVAQQLAVEPERCLVFEDIIPGIMAGKSAGMSVCAVEDAYSATQRSRKRELADYYIEDYCQLLSGEGYWKI